MAEIAQRDRVRREWARRVSARLLILHGGAATLCFLICSTRRRRVARDDGAALREDIAALDGEIAVLRAALRSTSRASSTDAAAANDGESDAGSDESPDLHDQERAIDARAAATVDTILQTAASVVTQEYRRQRRAQRHHPDERPRPPRGRDLPNTKT